MNLIPLFVLAALLFVAFVAAAVRASRPLGCPACGKRTLDAIETARDGGEIVQLYDCSSCGGRFRKRGDQPFEKL